MDVAPTDHLRHIKVVGLAGLFIFLFAALQGCGHKKEKTQKTDAQKKKDNYVRGELGVQKGMVLFNEHCANCHNFSQNEIGPNLSGITGEVSKDWLTAFINDPVAMIKSGDPRATETFAKYKMYMPAFPTIKGKDMENLLGFIHKFSQGEKRNNNGRTGGLINPIPDKIPRSDLALVLEEVLTVPASSNTAPLTRINKMATIGPPKSQRTFILDLRGKLYEMAKDTVRLYFDLGAQEPLFIHKPGFGTGFGSFAFHPEFGSNGLLYTTHTEPAKSQKADFAINDSIRTALQWVVKEWKTGQPGSTVFSGSGRELLRVDMRTHVHGIQEIAFNPLAKPGDPDHGKLYVTVGDGGAALGGLPELCAGNGTIWCSLLRIDPMGRNSTNGKYGIPNDNPFVNDPGALPEIWNRGHRNPNRMSWDRSGSGKMFISNIGQHSVEEINLGMAGADYGWPNREGTFLFDVNANPELVYPLPADDKGYTYPVAQYDHDEGNAVCGGYVYAGQEIPLLRNKYLFGDIPRGTLFYSEVSEMEQGRQAPIHKLMTIINGKTADLQSITPEQRVDLRFGEGPENALYVLTKTNGKVYKVVDCIKNAPVTHAK